MGYRLKTEMERTLHAECEEWGRRDSRWFDYALRLRSQREAQRLAVRTRISEALDDLNDGDFANGTKELRRLWDDLGLGVQPPGLY